MDEGVVRTPHWGCHSYALPAALPCDMRHQPSSCDAWPAVCSLSHSSSRDERVAADKDLRREAYLDSDS